MKTYFITLLSSCLFVVASLLSCEFSVTLSGAFVAASFYTWLGSIPFGIWAIFKPKEDVNHEIDIG